MKKPNNRQSKVEAFVAFFNIIWQQHRSKSTKAFQVNKQGKEIAFPASDFVCLQKTWGPVRGPTHVGVSKDADEASERTRERKNNSDPRAVGHGRRHPGPALRALQGDSIFLAGGDVGSGEKKEKNTRHLHRAIKRYPKAPLFGVFGGNWTGNRTPRTLIWVSF